MRVAVLVELDLHGSYPVQRFCVSGPSIDYDGHTWYSSGTILDVGDFDVTADTEVAGVDLELNGQDVNMLRLVRARHYRNRRQRIILLQMDDNAVIRAKRFLYFADSHSFEDDGRLMLHLKNVWIRFDQHTNTRSSGAEQAALIARGLLGNGDEDRAFDRAGLDFTTVGLGETRAGVQKTKTGIWPFRKTIRTPLPGKEATALKDDGSDYQRDIALGRCQLEGNLISAWNPAPSRVTARITNWADTPARTADSSRFVALVFAVAEGELADLAVRFTGVGDTNATRTRSFTADSTGWSYLTTGGRRFCAYQVRLGSRTAQTAFRDMTYFANDTNIWSDSHIGYGVALVAVIAQASEEWSGGGVPTIEFGTERGMKLATATGLSGQSAGTDGAPAPWALHDLLTSPIYGRGLAAEDLDLASFDDSEIRWLNTAHNIRLRGFLQGSLSLREKVQRILDAGSLFMGVAADGKLAMRRRELPTRTELAVAEGPYHFDPRRRGRIEGHEISPSTETYNRVTVSAPVANQSVETDDFETLIQDEQAFAQDNYQVSVTDVNFPLASVRLNASGNPYPQDLEHLRRLGQAELDRSRLGQRGSFKAPVWQTPDLSPGDVITISDPQIYGETTVYARVVRITYMPPALMSVDWVEYSPLIYQLDNGVAEFHATRVTLPG